MARLGIVLGLAVLVSPGSLCAAREDIQLLMTEDQLAPDEIKNKTAMEGTWWAIQWDGSQAFHPVSTTVTITKAAGSAWMNVSMTPRDPNTFFLVRGLTFDPSKEIPVAVLGSQETLTIPGHRIEGTFGKTSFTLEALGTPGRVPEEAPSDFKIVLGSKGKRQVLWDIHKDAAFSWDEPNFSIQWAGDLDHDNQLDLLLILTSKYTILPHKLFLSTRAAPGQLVGLAAEYVSGD